MTLRKCTLLIMLLAFPLSCQMDSSAPASGSGILSDNETGLNISTDDMPYMVGAGMQDITGPAAEVMFAGYCDFAQLGKGIFMRQYARAFILSDRRSGKSIVLVTAEIPMMSTGVYIDVIKKLKSKFKGIYDEKNVVLSATHTHSGPGGYFRTYALNIFAGMTFHQDNYDTIVNGIYEAIERAHHRLKPGRVYLNSGEFSYERFKRMNWQRSAEAYRLNRDASEYLLPDGTLDNANRTMTQLKLIRYDGMEIGMYNWAPIHPNVAGNHMFLINGDINGYASYLIERENGADYSTLNGFVAAFAYNDAADTSGNLPEDAITYNSDDNPDNNVTNNGTEPYMTDGLNDYVRLEKRARTVASLAGALFDEASSELTGPIDYRQVFAAAQAMPIKPDYIDEEDVYYADVLGESRETCRLCMGAAGEGFFAGSTEDGDSGMVNRGEGNPRDVNDYSASNLGDLLAEPVPSICDILLRTIVPGPELSAEMDCQLEKRMTLNFDELNRIIPEGKAWNLNQPFQILRIGTLGIVVTPFEVTTMSGRRIKKEVKSVLTDLDNVVVNSTSNCDLRYLTTREEYSSQQYEGGATLMGPYSLNAIRQVLHELAESFTPGTPAPGYAVDLETVEKGLEKSAIFKIAGNVAFDTVPPGKKFGSIHVQPEASYRPGTTVRAVFWGGHPNNNLTVRSHESFLVVEKKTETGGFVPVAHDWDPCTRYHWKRNSIANSLLTIEWVIPPDAAAGTYRIRHIGQRKFKWTRRIYRYEGVSDTFTVQ